MEKRGLNHTEAKERLATYGYNEIKEPDMASPLKILLRQVKSNFTIYFMTCALIVSFIVGKYITGYTIIGVIILVVTLGFIQEYRAEQFTKSLKGMITPTSTVIREGKEKEIHSREIVPGDILVIRSGDKVPADSLILDAKDLRVNESMLTGESTDEKKIIATSDVKYTDKNMIFMGTFITGGKCFCKVMHTGMNTRFGQISNMISTADKELPLQTKVNNISRYMALVAVFFAFSTVALMLLDQPLTDTVIVEALMLMIALSVSGFPEGFPVVLITALSSGAYRMSKKNAIVNRMSIIETLGETTVICSDKTGTITTGEMTVKKIFADNKVINVSGAGYDGEGELFIHGKKVELKKEHTVNLLLTTSVLCNDARIEHTGEKKLFHTFGSPTEAALLVMAAKANIYVQDLNFKRLEEVPFSSERKMMSVLAGNQNERYVLTKGAPEVLIKRCHLIARKNGFSRLSEKEKDKILDLNKEFAKESLRTMALAYKQVNLTTKDCHEHELIFLGIVGMEDPPREEVRESVLTCLKAGIQVKMITGDHSETAVSIARRIGLHGKSIEGAELDNMTEEELSDVVSEISIFARVRPEHKLKIVKALKMKGEIVTMTGDGVNDAPALKEAHIGVAMGMNGTDVSREVADLTLKDDNFATIVEAIREGRTIFKNIRKFVSFQLSCNYTELVVLFFGVLFAPLLGWQVPLLLALQILYMNLVTDDLPAITLSLTPSSKDIMEEKPRKHKDILHKALVYWMLIAGVAMAAITLSVFYVVFNVLGEEFEAARTTALVVLIFLVIAHAYNFMSFRQKVTPKSLYVNKYLFYSSLISIGSSILVIYTPLNKIFGTVPLGFIEWVVALGGAAMLVLLFNALKEINNKKKYFELEHI